MTTYDPDVHHRRSIRLQEYDYSQEGAYFITACSYQREPLFGEIVGNEVRLNALGVIVQEEWLRTGQVLLDVRLDSFAVMPNHFHGILVLVGVGASRWLAHDSQRANREAAGPSQGRATQRVAPTGPAPGSIGAIMAQFRSIVTKRINVSRKSPGAPVWQRSFYDHVLRNEQELGRARTYIVNNPAKWTIDEENPDFLNRT